MKNFLNWKSRQNGNNHEKKIDIGLKENMRAEILQDFFYFYDNFWIIS